MSRFHAAIGSRAWQVLRRQAIDRDGGRCTQCGRPGRLEVHHLVPLKDGGENTQENLTTLCRSCHISAHRPRPTSQEVAWENLLQEMRP